MRAAVIALGMAAALAAGASAAIGLEGTRPRREGWSDRSYYLAMPDGVRLAISLWFPDGRAPDRPAPAVLIQTRYGRGGVFSFVEGGRYKRLLAAGYVVAIVDTRGSTASFGDRTVEIGPDEVRDMDSLIRHLRSRPWSDGRVFVTGVSYMADTADIATGARARPDGAIVRQADFDAFLGLFAPGGVANDMMMSLWGGATLPRDYGRSVDPAQGLDCRLRVEDCPKLWPRLQPVDEDRDYALVRQAVARRRHWSPDDYRHVEFRDDKAANGYSMLELSPAGYLEAIRRKRVPVQYWGSWMDAGTADAAIARYRSAPRTAAEIWITANDHGGEALTDPFFPSAGAARPTLDEQWGEMLKFFAAPAATRRTIHYYVLGAGRFRTAAAWPPSDARTVDLWFAGGGRLSRQPPQAGRDRYTVDFTATSGSATRWSAQIGTPAAYGDRSAEDRKLLTYTSAPFAQDSELVGTPRLRLRIATRTSDPVVVAYLSDVSPSGQVTYLTEGLFRAVNRRPARPATLPYRQPEPAHSFRRADSLPVTPGRFMDLRFPLFSVAALIRKGHSLRVSLAGADAGTFRRYSNGEPEAWVVERGRGRSAVAVTIRPWRSS